MKNLGKILSLQVFLFFSMLPSLWAAPLTGIVCYERQPEQAELNAVVKQAVQTAVDRSSTALIFEEVAAAEGQAVTPEQLKRQLTGGRHYVLGVGADFVAPFYALAGQYPQTSFVVLDGEIEEPLKAKNLLCVRFAENEAGYLAGIVAATYSQQGKIGFIGGQRKAARMRSFFTGYEAGAQAVNSKLKVRTKYLGADFNTEKMQKAASSLYGNGCEVIFNATGASSLSLFQIAAQERKYAIGCNVDEGALAPAELRPWILTSALKRVERVIFWSVQAFVDGELEGGNVCWNLNKDGVGYADNQWNHGLLAKAQATLDDVEAQTYFGVLQIPQ
ncbi:MAG: BMP family ABC transporter substrate-binding protein [Acidaminococcaceae bacterium]